MTSQQNSWRNFLQSRWALVDRRAACWAIYPSCLLPAVERGSNPHKRTSQGLKSPLLIDPVSLAVPSCGHLFILLADGFIFSPTTISSDIGQGYEMGAGPLRGSGASSVVIFPRQREALEPGGSLRVQWVLAFWLKVMGNCTKEIWYPG